MVGFVILLGVVVAVAGSLWLSGSGFGRLEYPVDVLVSNVGQLREGNAVKFRGVQVGRVTEFVVDPDFEAVRIRLSLSDEMTMPVEPAAVIAPESLFGEWQVEIVSRSQFPRFAFFEVDAVTPPDSLAPLLGGFALPDLSRLTATADEISQDITLLTARVEQAFTEETANALANAIRNLETMSESLRDLVDAQAETITEVGSEVRDAAIEIAAAARAGRSTLEQTDSLLARGEVGQILESMEVVSINLAAITTDVSASTDEIQSVLLRADSTFARFDRLAAKVERGEGFLGQIVNDTMLVGQTSGVLSELELLLRDLRENPKRYVRLSIF